MLRLSYSSIYSSGITVEYLTQILTRVPKYLQLLNIRIFSYRTEVKRWYFKVQENSKYINN